MQNAVAILPDKDQWAQMKEIAQMAVKSGLLPTSIKSPEAAAIIALKGHELGLPPMVAFAHIVVINGKPTTSAEIMLAYIYKEYPKAVVDIVERTKERCVIDARRPNEEKLTRFTFDLDRAKRMGLLSKDNWQKQPETMLFWRCVTEMKRGKFPEVLMGIDFSAEELGADITADGQVRDVSPRSAQPTNSESTTEIKTVKNFAPQTAEQARDWKPGEFTESVVEPNPEPETSHPSAEELKKTRDLQVAEIFKIQQGLGWQGKQLVDFIGERFQKNASDLTNDEVGQLLEIMKQEKPK